MKQLLQSLKTGQTYVADVPIPSVRPGAVLVRTAASLVSAGTERMVVDFAQKSLLGKARSRPDLVRQLLDKARREGWASTLDAARNRLDQPMPLGYSSAGTVVRVGEGVEGVKPGDRVACAGGNWAVHAEYAVVPRNLIAHLPDGLSFDEAAFATLGAIAMHGFRLSGLQLGETAAVIGLGLLGQLAAGIARAAGCRVFGVDLDPARVALAADSGVQAVLRSEAEDAARAFTRGLGFDAVLICADTSSDDPVTLAGEIARDRATVVAIGAVGLQLPRRSYFAKEITFLNSRSYGPGRYDPAYEEKGRDYPVGYVRWTEGRNLASFVDLLGRGLIDVRPLISHRFPIDQAPEAYEFIRGKRGEAFLGVLLTYGEGIGNLESRISNRESAGNASGATLEAPDSRFEIPDSRFLIRLGVIGAGNFASAVMLPAVRKIPGIGLIGITSAGGANARHLADKFGFTYAADEASEILADPQIDSIAVLTRHADHADLVLAALAAGKHVFCEKPLALNPAELDAIAAAVHAHPEILLTVGFNRRFAPMSLALAEFLDGRSQPLHMTCRVNAGYLPPEHWLHDPEQGGGRIIGEGCHFVDLLTFLAGAPPVDVAVHGLPDEGIYREDNVQMTFTFPDGSVGAVSYLANGDKAAGKERVEVFCGGRVAVLDDFRSLTLIRDGRRTERKSRLRQDKGHAAIWSAFSAAAAGGGPAPIPFDHLAGVTRATFAAVQALRSGATVEIASLAGDG